MHNIMFITAVIEIKNYCEHSRYPEHLFERDLSPSKNWCGEHNAWSAVTIATSVARHEFTYYTEKHIRKTTPCIPTLG